MKKKVLFIFGTRPEAIKLAPVIKEFERRKDKLQTKICLTAQHRHILDQVLETFKIRPDFDLNIMSEGQTLFDVHRRVLRDLEQVLIDEKPDLIFVQGDTTTAFVSALAAFYKRIPIGHIEAGLRTEDKFAPFPEEMNRRLLSHIADFHFAPTKKAKDNLLKEGIPGKRIYITGNTVIDALFLALKMNPEQKKQKAESGKRIILITCHRRESFGKPFERILEALKILAQKRADIELIYPVHPNPNIRIPARRLLGNQPRIQLIPPLDYLPFVYLMNSSYLILTDSGGIQEEAPALGKPVLVLREKTERPEAIEAGTARLVGTSTQKIIKTTELLLNSEQEYRKMAKAKNPFGDGKAAKRILRIVLTQLAD